MKDCRGRPNAPGILSRLLICHFEVKPLNSLDLQMKRKIGDEVRAVRAAGMLLPPPGVVAHVAEDRGGFQFAGLTLAARIDWHGF